MPDCGRTALSNGSTGIRGTSWVLGTALPGKTSTTVQLADKLNPGNATADHKRGGKFLQHHGLSDAPVSPDSSIYYYYDQASSAVEPQSIEMDDFYRLFLTPETE